MRPDFTPDVPSPPSAGEGQSSIRPLEIADIDTVAALFQQVFRDSAAPAPASLAAYLRWIYFDMPGCDREITPLVHINEAGEISGFIGANALQMRHGDRILRAAICGSLMVSNHEADPMAGARLMRSFLAGPQDISFSETASEVSARMWERLRGSALLQYSLDWVRVIRPMAFAVEVTSSRLKAARLFSPLARGLDHFAVKRVRPGQLMWIAASGEENSRPNLTTVEIDAGAFAALVEPLTQQFSLRPDWADGQIEAILADAALKTDKGELLLARIETRTGHPIGAFACHIKSGRIAHVLQILARPGQEGAVIDCLIAEAARRGAAGLRGRTQPALFEAMLGRRISFTHMASTVIHSRDPELVHASRNGELFFNGIAGENWSRLVDHNF